MSAIPSNASPAATEAPDSSSDSAPSQTIQEIMQHLDSIKTPSYTASMLRAGYTSQKEIMTWMQALGTKAEITITEIDGLILRWLHSCYLHISSLPAFSKNRLPLATLIAVSNLLSPFVKRSEENHEENQLPLLEIGFPTKDASADSLSELLRLVGAAICCYNEYLSRTCKEGTIPMDEAALLFSTLAIRSCLDEKNAIAFAAQIEEARTTFVKPKISSGDDITDALSTMSLMHEASSFDNFQLDEIRFLMHWLRSELCYYFSDVQYILGNKQGHQGHMEAAQQDRLCLLKLSPSNLSAYVLYARSCLQFQQHKAAFIFSSKGITVAQKLQDDAHLAQLYLINATAAALGGSGETFSLTHVIHAHSTALTLRDQCLSWLPLEYHELLELEPELTIVSDKVIANLSGSANEKGEVLVPYLRAHYAISEPKSVPPGAVEEDGKGGVLLRRGAFDSIEEGAEQEEEEAPEQVGKKPEVAAKKALGAGNRTKRRK